MRFAQRHLGLFAVAVSVTIWLAALQPWHWYMGDLIVYRGGGHALLHGLPLYSVVSGRHQLHFTYPPFAALFAAALAALPLAVAKVLLSTLTAAALYASIRIFVRQVEREGHAFVLPFAAVVFAVAIWLEPVRATFDFGQVNALLMWLVVADVLSLDGRRLGGIGIGIAAAIKLTPLAFVLYLVATGRVRQSINAVGAFVVCGLVGVAVDPSGSKTYWVQHRFLSAHRIGRVENASNQSVRGVIARLVHSQDVPPWWLAIAVGLLIGGLALVRLAHRSGRESQAIAVMAVATLCVSPVSWSHHWVWCALIVVVAVDLARRHPTAGTLAGTTTVVLPFALGLVFWAPHAAHLELHDSAVQQLLSASYVLAGILLCLLVALDLRRTSGQGEGLDA